MTALLEHGPRSRSEADTLAELRAYWETAGAKVPIIADDADELSALVRHHRAAHADSDTMVRSLQRPGADVLDLYYGAGLDAVDAARAGARATFASPIARHGRQTRLLADRMGATVETVIASPERLPFANGSFDAVLARGALMYSPEPVRAVREAARVLRPGGTLIAVLLNRKSWYPPLKRLSGQPLVEPSNPPFLNLTTAAEAQPLFAPFGRVDLTFGRFPAALPGARGSAAAIFNRVIVPAFRLMPRRWVQGFGYYILVRAEEPA